MMRFRGPHNLPRWTHPTVPSHRSAGPQPPPLFWRLPSFLHLQTGVDKIPLSAVHFVPLLGRPATSSVGPRTQIGPIRSRPACNDLLGYRHPSLSSDLCRRGRLTCRHVSCWTTRVGTGDRTIPDFDFAISRLPTRAVVKLLECPSAGFTEIFLRVL